MLSFAHAVGSPEGVFNAACSQLHELEVVVNLPEQSLRLCGSYSFYTPTQLQLHSLYGDVCVSNRLTSEQQAQEVAKQVTEQTEGLLRMAHMLRLQRLIDVLHTFIRENTGNVTSS